MFTALCRLRSSGKCIKHLHAFEHTSNSTHSSWWILSELKVYHLRQYEHRYEVSQYCRLQMLMHDSQTKFRCEQSFFYFSIHATNYKVGFGDVFRRITPSPQAQIVISSPAYNFHLLFLRARKRGKKKCSFAGEFSIAVNIVKLWNFSNNPRHVFVHSNGI